MVRLPCTTTVPQALYQTPLPLNVRHDGCTDVCQKVPKASKQPQTQATLQLIASLLGIKSISQSTSIAPKGAASIP